MLRRQELLNETRIFGSPLTDELVVAERELLRSRQSAECRRDWTYGMEAVDGKQEKGLKCELKMRFEMLHDAHHPKLDMVDTSRAHLDRMGILFDQDKDI